MKARIISAHGRHYVARTEQGQTWHCYTKGKKAGVCVGDWVMLSAQSETEARIETVLPRRNLLYRSDQMRSKQFAANVDALLFVTAVEPAFSDDLLGRALTAALHEGIAPVLILNKCDLVQGLEAARQQLGFYKTLGIPVVEVSTLHGQDLKEKLYPHLNGKTSLLLGQSAMGKSSILNVLIPHANAFTQAHSQALGAGKHTTTLTQLYALPDLANSYLIDSPGFQAFGLLHLDDEAIVAGFPEFKPYLGKCRFYNCKHLKEPHCAITQAVEDGAISPQRYALYERLVTENDQASRW